MSRLNYVVGTHIFVEKKELYRNFSFVRTCTDPESFVRGGPNSLSFFLVFLVVEGIEDSNTALKGPSSSRLKWRFAGEPMMAQH